ncbi:recombinase family protein [Niameybacter massiliensis]|uniref:Recombinase family protein n=1 Tax=Holtiella tumoricola TaxID=3018743 RepID=A0AA42DLH9_9FIRM|nr:recombinase family protein [Holtiella tumoricola]MDA3731340.1 recombinase family protein [Holtiella tumoricola]
MQTHLPIGYKMVEGKIHIDQEKADTVKKIYNEYVNGKSMLAIAKRLKENEIPNANHKTNWTHGAVGKILQNTKYMGDDLHPPLVSKELFDQAQKKRKEKTTQLGRTAQLNSMNNHHAFTNRIFCGECGEPYRKYVEHCGKPHEKVRWKCKRYIFNNKVVCKNLFYSEDEIKTIVTSSINKLLQKQNLLDKPYRKEPLKKDMELKAVESQIKELEEQEQFSSPLLAQLSFKRAELMYRVSRVDDYQFNTQKMKDCLKDVSEPTDFNEELIVQIVKKIIIYKDGKIEAEFINGLKFC